MLQTLPSEIEALADRVIPGTDDLLLVANHPILKVLIPNAPYEGVRWSSRRKTIGGRGGIDAVLFRRR